MAPAYAVPRLLERHGLTLQDFDLVRDPRGVRRPPCSTTLAAWEDPEFCRDRLGLDAPARRDRPDAGSTSTGSSLAAGHPFAATGGRIVATLAKLLHENGDSGRGPDLDLRRRRPGRRRDPRGGLMADATTALRRPLRRQTPVAQRSGCRGPPTLRRLQPSAHPLLDGPVARRVGRRRPARRAGRAALLEAQASTSPTSRPRATARRRRRSTPPVRATLDRPRRRCSELVAPALQAAAARAAGCSARAGAAGADGDPEAAAAAQALDGLIRSIGKELRAGATANLSCVRRRRRAGGRRLDAAVLPVRPLGLRRRAGRPGRRAGRRRSPSRADWATPAGRPGRRGHRRRPRHRRGHRRHAGPRRRHRRLRRHPGRRARRWPASPTGSAAPRCSSTSPRPTPRQRLARRTCASGTAASTSSCTTPASPATSCSPTWTPTAGTSVLDVNLGRSCAINDALLADGVLRRRRPRRLRVLDQRHRRQPRPDQLRGVARPGVIGMVGALRRRGSPSAASRSTRSRPASSRPR